MDAKDKKKLELPEVLEFLKLVRTVKRQLQLFSEVEISEENLNAVKKAVNMMKDEVEKFTEATKEGE